MKKDSGIQELEKPRQSPGVGDVLALSVTSRLLQFLIC
jgi:hypothetical protein